MAIDDAPRNLDLVPTFSPPSPSTSLPPAGDPGPATEPGPELHPHQPGPWNPSRGGGLRLFGPPSPRQDTNATHTATSDSTGSRPKKATGEDAAKAVAGILALAAAAAAALIKWRLKRKLRQPTQRQVNDMARPLGNIIMRHGALSDLPEDLGDIVAFGAAVGNYINDDAPLLGYLVPDSGVPSDLQEDPYAP